MAKRSKQHYPTNPLNLGTLINVGAQLLTAAGIVGGFYFVTNWRLTEVETATKTEMTNREKDRDDFGKRFDTMNGALSTLNTHAAVQDETLKTISAQLGAYLSKRQ
jgi:hypothetical protein